MGKARLDIEKKMVPQGPGVSRHLSLPPQGHDFEWILAEMAKMDEQSEHAHWNEGKVSGAVYRESAGYSFVHGLDTTRPA